MTNNADSLRLLAPIPVSPLKKEWPEQNTGDPNEGKPLHRYFGVYGELPFGETLAREGSIWTDIITYSQHQDYPKKAIEALPNKLGIHPWQLCGAMPVDVDDSPKIAAKRITKLFYGQNGGHNIPSLTQGEFLAKATSHFEAIKYIDIELGMKRFPRTLGELVKICRQRLGLSQRELGDATGYSEDSIYRIESNAQGIPLETTTKFVEVFQLIGKGREMFYKLSGYNLPEAHTKALTEEDNLGDFVCTAREQKSLTQGKLAKLTKYPGEGDISKIEGNKKGIRLKKVDSFVPALSLEGIARNHFYKLSGHRSQEACLEAMKTAVTLGNFVKAARERQRIEQKELARLTGYKHKSSIITIEGKKHGIPLDKVERFITELSLEGEYRTIFLRLVSEFKRTKKAEVIKSRQAIHPEDMAFAL